ncbi:hypothetical protein [Hyalangium versicolor]|uniref:hypothetical protein n=1 Tax=Hyalangium versicolor TaxID=2861190 RepID=UPI001CC98B59|nr:hypothetical protein [Hyalangium versicolor]
MRKRWLGVVALLVTAGCTHNGLLRPQSGMVPLTEDGTAAVTGDKGVMLVAYASNWKGQPRNLEQHFTPIEVRVENRSGRALSIRYEGFELEGRKQYVARAPKELGQILAMRDATFQPARDVYGTWRPPRSAYQNRTSTGAVPSPDDTTYNSYNGISPYTAPPCLTCVSDTETASLPSQDMLRMALAEGALEDGQSRQGFLYFEEPLRTEAQATLKVALVDATTGEPFGSLSIPFEVH